MTNTIDDVAPKQQGRSRQSRLSMSRGREQQAGKAINTVSELTTVQACIIHLIRNTLRYGSRKYWDQIAHDLRRSIPPLPKPRPGPGSRSSPRSGASRTRQSSGCGRTPGLSSCRSWTTTWRIRKIIC
jgi:hypothetical protein